MSTLQNNTARIRALSMEGLIKLAEGESAFRAAAAMYAENIPDASPEEAELTARRIAGAVRQYGAGIAEAGEDPEKWANARLDELTEGRNVQGRCAAIAQATAVLQAVSGEPLSDQEKDYSRATEEDESALRGEFIRLAGNSRLFGTLTAGIAEAAAAVEEDEDIREAAAKAGKEEDLKTVTAMAAYIETVRDGQQNVPPEAVALCVSAGMDAVDNKRGAVLGKMSEEKSKTIREIITLVLTVLVIVAIIYAALVLLPQLPAVLPASVKPHVQWLAPMIKRIGYLLPAMLTVSYRAIFEGCRSVVNTVWHLFKGRERVMAVDIWQEEARQENDLSEEAGEKESVSPAAASAGAFPELSSESVPVDA